jgi:hypothetical protein
MSERPRLIQVIDPLVTCSWGFAEDVQLYGYTPEGQMVVIGLSSGQARTLADQLFRAANQAQDCDEGYEEAERKCQERDRRMAWDFVEGRDYPEGAILILEPPSF